MRTSVVRSKLRTNPMEHPPTESNVIQALSVVYDPTSSQEQRDQAENWLIAFRSTREAWDVSVGLLKSNNPVIAHFAAHSLQEKVKTQWHSLSPENQTVLFSLLMTYFRTWSNGPNLLLTRISLTIAQIALHVFPNHYPTFLDDIIKFLDPNNCGKDMSNAILTLLRVLPEELEDAMITEERRSAVLKAFRNESNKIIPLLIKYLQVDQNNEELKLSALKCLVNWKIPVSTLIQTPLLDYIFECIRTYDSVIQYASDYLIEQLESSTIRNYPTIRTAILKKFILLEDRLLRSVQENNHTTAFLLVQMFANLGDLLCDIIAQDREAGPKLAMILARCGNHPDKDVSTMSFRFWFELQSHLCDLDEGCEQREWFIEPFSTMVQVLRDQCVFPDTSGWTAEQHDRFTTFRSEAGDTIMYCYDFLKSKCHEVLYSLLQQDLQQYNNPRQWALIEATVYSFRSTSETVEENDDYIAKVIGTFPSFPVHTQLYQTALHFLGDISQRWLRKREPSIYLPVVFSFLVQGLTREEPAEIAAAAAALQQVSIYCRQHLLSCLDYLVKVVEPLLLSGRIEISTKCLLLEAVVQILDLVELPYSVPIFSDLTKPIINRITALMRLPQSPQTKTALLGDLRLFCHSCTIIAEANEGEEELCDLIHKTGHPMLGPLQILWPLFGNILQIYVQDDDILEEIMKILRHSLRNINAHLFAPLLPSFIEMICACYQSNSNYELIRTFSRSIAIFSPSKNSTLRSSPALDEQKRIEIFGRGLASLASNTFARMSKDVNMWPRVTKDFFEVLSQVLKDVPEAMLGTKNGAGHGEEVAFSFGIDFFSVAVQSLLYVEDRLAHKAITTFLKDFVSTNHPLCKHILFKNLQPLLEVIYKGISNTQISRSMIPSFATAMMALRDFYPNELRLWTIELFKQPDFPSPVATPDVKQQFLKDLFLWRHRDFNDKLHSFAVICRGLDLKFGISSKPFI